MTPCETQRHDTLLDGLFLVVSGALVALASLLLRLDGLIGLRNDDGLYVLMAKGLASGAGLVNLADPAHPPAMPYPVGFPLLLAPVFWWRADWPGQASLLEAMAVGFAVLFVWGAYLFLRRGAGWRPVGAGLAACLIALHPETHFLGGKVLSDLPYAVIALAALWAIERGRARPDVWLLAGVLGGLAALVRYQGLTLALAVAGVLLVARQARPLGLFAAGWGLVWGPWLIWRSRVGSEVYATAYTEATPSRFLEELGQSATYVFGQALPGLLAPALFEGRGLALWGGFGVSALVLWGAWRMLRSPKALSPVPGAFLLVTVALVVVWSRAFLYLEDELATRLLLPLAPLVFLALARAAEDLGLRLRLPETRLRPFALALAMVGLVLSSAIFNRNLHQHRSLVLASRPQAEYAALFSFLREQTPETARLFTWLPAMVHLYTGRSAFTAAIDEPSPEALARLLAARRVDFVVGSPQMRSESDRSKVTAWTHPQTDLSVLRLNALQQAYPGLLTPVWVNPRGTMVVFALDRTRLE